MADNNNNNKADEQTPTDTTGAQNNPVKPALKKDSKPTAAVEEKHLKWDEAAISEHDLLRGTRMKIDEPNTPYTHYDSGAESDCSGGDRRRPKSPATQKESISWDNLQTRLDSVKAVQEAFPSSPDHSSKDEDTNTDTDDEKHRKEMRKLEFREHRKRHYNEMELVKKFRAEHPEGLEADEEDDDNHTEERYVENGNA